ncbi:MAG: c-type cytochrome [Polyangiaceae bacterium]|nr:c-type cytochrome [Polyangiaceae bacterium]
MISNTAILSRVIALAGAAGLASCAGPDPDAWDPDVLGRGLSSHEEIVLERGRESYSMYCAGCHGEQGDGDGPAARFMTPKPRDFRTGKVKFAGVSANEIPRDEDLAHTITHGLAGTAMPAWNLLPPDELAAIIAYIKTFTPNRKAPGAAVPIPPDPWAKKPGQGVEEGKRVYHGIAACMNCHPAYVTRAEIVEHQKAYDIKFAGFREGLYSSETKASDWGAPIRPPDFLADRVKSGSTKEDLVRVIAAGVGGTAMPSWGTSLTPKQLWGLAHYVESLAAMRGTPEGRALRSALATQPEFVPPPPPPPAPPPDQAPAGSAAPDSPPAAGDKNK